MIFNYQNLIIYLKQDFFLKLDKSQETVEHQKDQDLKSSHKEMVLPAKGRQVELGAGKYIA